MMSSFDLYYCAFHWTDGSGFEVFKVKVYSSFRTVFFSFSYYSEYIFFKIEPKFIIFSIIN